MKAIVTGGAGFIGSAVVRQMIEEDGADVVNLDACTYAANLRNVAQVADSSRYCLEQVDIRDAAAVRGVFERHRPDAVIHLAAETHVDRSIEGPAEFISTNVVGTGVMLDAALAYWSGLESAAKDAFRFIHVSTDEVYGSLGPTGLFTERSPYQPSSPYSASKAGSDHLARAWEETYGLPVIVTNCTNNYGPFQFPEKLIPLLTIKALRNEPLPVYGKGDNVRDWLYVEDHARALRLVLEKGKPGRTYNIGGQCERSNIDVVRAICGILDRLSRRADGKPHDSAITFVADRPGHDFRYAMDISRIQSEIGWSPSADFDHLLERTVTWYLEHPEYWQDALAAKYAGERLGISRKQ